MACKPNWTCSVIIFSPWGSTHNQCKSCYYTAHFALTLLIERYYDTGGSLLSEKKISRIVFDILFPFISLFLLFEVGFSWCAIWRYWFDRMKICSFSYLGCLASNKKIYCSMGKVCPSLTLKSHWVLSVWDNHEFEGKQLVYEHV